MNSFVVVFHNIADDQVAGNLIEKNLRERGQERNADGVCSIEYDNGSLLLCPDATLSPIVQQNIREALRQLEPPKARKALVIHQNSGAKGEHKTLRRGDDLLPYATIHQYSHSEWDPVYQGIVRLLKPGNNDLLGNMTGLGGEQILSIRLFHIRVEVGTILERLNLCLRYIEDADFDTDSRYCHRTIIQGRLLDCLGQVYALLYDDDSVKFIAEEFQDAGHVLKIDELHKFFPTLGDATPSIFTDTDLLDRDIPRTNNNPQQKDRIIRSIHNYSAWCGELMDALNEIVNAAEKLEKQDASL